jgi:hypothetical protein
MSTQNPGSRYTDGSLDLRHVSQLLDGSDQISGLRLVQGQKTLTYVSPGVRISELDDRATRVLPYTDGSDFLSLFQNLKCPDLLDLENSDIPNVDIPISQLLSGLSPSCSRSFKTPCNSLPIRRLSGNLLKI